MCRPVITDHILDSLRKPSAYPIQTTSVDLIQTHISWLFLTDTHVYKIKKPVNFSFLDFSTLELRHFYCDEELRLNRRLCPELYERVVALCKSGDGATFCGGGEVIDYAVVMKRLPDDRMLDKLVDSNDINIKDIQLIAGKIAAFHAKAETSAHISTFGSLEQIRFNWSENFEQTLQFQSLSLPIDVRRTIQSYVESFMESYGGLFARRVLNGYIRDCDGDIHLGNICLTNGSAYIFDCIEFNERFRFSDTAADIAFLLMDLDFHGRHDLAEAALSFYESASADTELSCLIPFYKIYRAFIRGKVESMMLLDSSICEEARIEAQKRAIRYFRLAQGYCLRDRLPPTLFIMCGTMGCGKSTLAVQLAFELGLMVFSSDLERKKLAGIPQDSAVHVEFGEGLYSNQMNEVTYTHLKQLAASQLLAGRSVIIDAAFGNHTCRSLFARLAESRQTEFVILYISCSPEEQVRRLKLRSASADSVSDGREELVEQQQKSFVPPQAAEGNIIAVSSEGTADTLTDEIYRKLFTFSDSNHIGS